MYESHRNKQPVMDACSGRSGALMAALETEVEYMLM